MNHALSGYLMDVPSADFAGKVIHAAFEVPVIVDFSAPGCATRGQA